MALVASILYDSPSHRSSSSGQGSMRDARGGDWDRDVPRRTLFDGEDAALPCWPSPAVIFPLGRDDGHGACQVCSQRGGGKRELCRARKGPERLSASAGAMALGRRKIRRYSN